jgi:hypothetical protein
VGTTPPASSRESAGCVMPARVARSTWDRPRASRRSRTAWPIRKARRASAYPSRYSRLPRRACDGCRRGEGLWLFTQDIRPYGAGYRPGTYPKAERRSSIRLRSVRLVLEAAADEVLDHRVGVVGG